MTPKSLFYFNPFGNFYKGHCSNIEKSVKGNHYLEDIRCEKIYLSEQYSLVIRDTFKDQTTDTFGELCGKTNCDVVTARHVFSHKF